MAVDGSSAVLGRTDIGSGPAVVLIPGLTFTRAAWDPIIERVSGRLRCIAIDLPGHGDSTGELSPWAAGDHIVRLIAEFELDRPVVVGHSLGGAIAWGVAADSPVSGLVTVDQPVDLRPMAATAAAIAPTLAGPGFEQAWGMVRAHIGRDLVAEPLRSQLKVDDQARPELVAGYWADLLADPQGLQERVAGMLARIEVPVLALFGHELEDAERDGVRAALPAAEVTIEEWPGAGHCVHLVEPDRFAARLVEFVRGR